MNIVAVDAYWTLERRMKLRDFSLNDSETLWAVRGTVEEWEELQNQNRWSKFPVFIRNVIIPQGKHIFRKRIYSFAWVCLQSVSARITLKYETQLVSYLSTAWFDSEWCFTYVKRISASELPQFKFKWRKTRDETRRLHEGVLNYNTQ